MSELRHYGWLGTIKEFIDIPEEAILSALMEHHELCMNMRAEASQITAWRNSIKNLKNQLSTLTIKYPKTSTWAIIFEYELPRERGRRPDVIILSDKDIFILEFKDREKSREGFIDQVSAYARDIQNYQAESHDKNVHPILVLTFSKDSMFIFTDVWVTSPIDLCEVFTNIIDFNKIEKLSIDPLKWSNADYAPLPSLVNAAIAIFQDEKLPKLKSVERADIDGTIDSLLKIAEQAQNNNELHLALVTGVPGSGKTLVGLQLVYHNHFNDDHGRREAIFLSGNRPLVSVLRHALDNKIFIQGVHDFLKQYGGNNIKSPEEHIWVFDEAQRAWDRERVKKYRKLDVSEPEDFLVMGERMGSWALLIGLIGEGQEIYLGEEGGLTQWNDAIAKLKKPLTVHCSNKIANIFTNTRNVCINNKLDLTISLRSHLAEDVQIWVKLLLDGQLAEAKMISNIVRSQGFEMYVTRNLRDTLEYISDRYTGNLDKKFGYIASSTAYNLKKHGFNNDFISTEQLKKRIGEWYNDDPDSKYSCCQLKDVATEFLCQGLELDFPIIGWGNDLLWADKKWNMKKGKSIAHDPYQLRLNSYRVLLSRGRDGFIIFVPDEKELDTTYEALLDSGIVKLSL